MPSPRRDSTVLVFAIGGAAYANIIARLDQISERLDGLDQQMSDLGTQLGLETDAINALAARIADISGPMQAALDAANAALAQAQADDVTDKAQISDLQAQVSDALTQVQTHIDSLNALAQPPAPPA